MHFYCKNFAELGPACSRYPAPIVAKVRELANSLADADIVQKLNEEGLPSAKGKRFTLSMIKWLRYKHSIPAAELKQKNELSVKEVAHKFDVNPGVVYYWLNRGIVTARRTHGGARCWIALEPEKEQELTERVNRSSRIKRK